MVVRVIFFQESAKFSKWAKHTFCLKNTLKNKIFWHIKPAFGQKRSGKINFSYEFKDIMLK
jgi:hypothetical protein